MFNYEPEELAAALHASAEHPMTAWCGVPATLFTTGTAHEALADFGERIARAFGQRVILNVGDILPTNGDIQGVIALGRRMQSCLGASA
jgi:hypothetical protein